MKDLTEGKESKLILRFTLPMLLGNLFQQTYSIVDSIIVGKFLGKEALAAVGASFPLIYSLIAIVIGIGSGIAIVISQYFGAKDMHNVQKAVNTTYIFLFIVSCIVPIIGISFSESIFKLLQLPSPIIPLATSYFNIYIAGSIAFFGFYGTASILRGLGDSKNPLYFVVISTILNIFLDLYCVLVLNWGVEGVAFATVLSQLLTFAFAIIYLNKTHKVIKFKFLKMKFDVVIFRKSVKIGLPFGIQQLLVALGMVALLGIVDKFGTDVVAAYVIATRLDAFAILPSINFAAAISVFVGQNIGANKRHRIAKGVNATLTMSSIICLIIASFILIFKTKLMGIFINDERVIQVGQEYLTILSISYILFNIMFIFNGTLRGAGATMFTLYVTILALWIVRIPLAYILSMEIGIIGIWLATPIAWMFGALGSFLYYKYGNWRNKIIMKTDIE